MNKNIGRFVIYGLLLIAVVSFFMFQLKSKPIASSPSPTIPPPIVRDIVPQVEEPETKQKAPEVYPDNKEILEIKTPPVELIKEDIKVEIPEKIEPDGEKDIIELSFGTLTIAGPPGWEKKFNVTSPTGTQVLIQYTKVPGVAFPCIGVSEDKAFTGVHSAMEFSQKMKEMILQYSPKTIVTEPQEQTINGHQVSYMEVASKGLHNIDYRHGWYQFLFDGHIIIVQYLGSEDQLKEGEAEFRKVIESLKFKSKP